MPFHRYQRADEYADVQIGSRHHCRRQNKQPQHAPQQQLFPDAAGTGLFPAYPPYSGHDASLYQIRLRSSLRIAANCGERASAQQAFPAYRGPWYTLCLPEAMVMKIRNRA